MFPITDEIKHKLFSQGDQVIIKPWSQCFNPKATLAPFIKKGEITDLLKNNIAIVKSIEGETSFYTRNLIILKKSLANISDEDAIEVSNILGYSGDNLKIVPVGSGFDIMFGASISITIGNSGIEVYDSNAGYQSNGEDIVVNSISILNSYQYLESKGYALPYLGYSVVDLCKADIYYIINPIKAK